MKRRRLVKRIRRVLTGRGKRLVGNVRRGLIERSLAGRGTTK